MIIYGNLKVGTRQAELPKGKIFSSYVCALCVC
jgi:hypothetical protein